MPRPTQTPGAKGKARTKKETRKERAKRRRPFKPPAGRSPFLELPTELRTMILSLVLTRNEPIRGMVGGMTRLGIFRANKQLYFEAAPIWYGINIFKLTLLSPVGDHLEVSGFIRSIGTFAKYLRHIEIDEVANEDSDSPELCSTITALGACTHLQTIALPHRFLCYFSDEDSWDGFDDLTYDLLRATYDVRDLLQKEKQSQGIDRHGIPEIKVVAPDPCRSCYVGPNLNNGGFTLEPGCVRREETDCEVECPPMRRHCEDIEIRVNEVLIADRHIVLGQLQELVKKNWTF